MLNASRRAWPCASTIIAGKSALSACIGSIETWRLTMTKNRERQRAIRHLLSLDDRLLDDIGLTRSDLIAEFGRSPIERLQKRRN